MKVPSEHCNLLALMYAFCKLCDLLALCENSESVEQSRSEGEKESTN